MVIFLEYRLSMNRFLAYLRIIKKLRNCSNFDNRIFNAHTLSLNSPRHLKDERNDQLRGNGTAMISRFTQNGRKIRRGVKIAMERVFIRVRFGPRQSRVRRLRERRMRVSRARVASHQLSALSSQPRG